MAARLTTYLVAGIVAATLIAGMMAGAQKDDDGPVDLIVHNASVFTADGDGSTAEAVAIRGNQILRVGNNREVLRLARPQTIMVDANGASVLPGFNDSHVHLIEGGLALEALELLDARTPDEIAQKVRAWADAHPDQAWIVGRGWRRHLFAGGLPSRHQLDAVVQDRPVVLLSADGRMSWVNSKALRLAGVSRRTPDPAAGEILRDPHTGEPTGVLGRSAMALVGRLLPAATQDDRARALRAAIAEAHRHGITSVQNAAAVPADFELYENARRAGELTLRVYSAVSAGGAVFEEDLDRLGAILDAYPDDPLFKAGALKVVLDGSVDAHSAATIEPYAAGERAVEPAIAADDLNRMVRLADARGWQVMTHAAGDRAVRMALYAYEHAVRSNRAPARGRRHRIEHAETVAPRDRARFAPLGTIASVQPLHAAPDRLRLDGPERASDAWPLRALANARARLAFGSDWPAASMDPMLALHTAVNRTTADGRPEGGWNPEQRLSLEAAVKAYTSGAAWASFDDERKGTLEAGMLADLVVLSTDIFAAPPSALADTAVTMTIFDGRIVYRRDGRSFTD
jgi:predicted amidohydrolase YtcJ